ncbi:hypothetical protein Ddye_018257 [Dipteronia dyeriana]|uniref:Uncharacterized protein n=1 Tax=Dipteronia dyeriana TaxID=168575 RepID=A0AAD9UAU8_9ROSI|nr:hypothetical protein Ddye_018257 [Dipteronia dyeriana]
MAAKTTTFFVLLFFSLNLQCSSSDNWIRAGYWVSSSAFPVSEINSALFTHLMCAFARINSSTYHILIDSTYEQSFSNFTNTVKRKNPSVITLLSIWAGKQDSAIFSSMINQSSSRQSFIESSIETARLYGFDGLDLVGVMAGNSTSMTNLGTLLEDWRAALVASESSNSGKSELLMVMTGYNFSETRLLSYPVESMKKSLDWVVVLAFDYYLPTRYNFTGPHSALYGSSSSSSWLNVNNSIQEWLNRGFLATKLVLCMPYHGYAWILVNANDNSVGAPASGQIINIDGSMGYKYIKSFIEDYGYGAASVYNGTFGVNFFTIGQTWINFDSVEAIRAKVSFAKEKGLLGYSVFQLGNDDNWELSTVAKGQGGKDQKNERPLLIIILIIVAMAILLIGTIVCYLKRKFNLKSRMKNRTSATENFSCNGHNLLVLSFTTIREATDNFASGNKIGEGGYGPVYKGRLPNGQEVAVKRLSKFSHQGWEEFKNEVELTERLQHVNLVPVLGICNEKEEKMLIYEFMPNKSLDFYIFASLILYTDPHRRYLLDWRKRAHIIEGITQGLLYLQEYSNFTIIHRDLKASNVLLDSDMNPKISDFGMAKAFTKDEREANTRRIVGTYGYVPPEYVRNGIYSKKYDVYSYGVLLLQIISGKRTACYYGPNDSFNLLEFAYKLWKDGEGMEFFDSSLDDSSSTWKLMRCMQVALLCVQENPADRPTMLEVYTLLKNEIATITTPREPAFSFTRDEDEEINKCRSEMRKCSINYESITQLVPR